MPVPPGLPPEARAGIERLNALRAATGGPETASKVNALAQEVVALGLAYDEVQRAGQESELATFGYARLLATGFGGCGMELGPREIAAMKRALSARERARGDMAVGTAAIAALEAVLAGGDPKALDAAATELASRLGKGGEEPTDDAALTYVHERPASVAEDRAHMEAALKAAWGDQAYAMYFKPRVDVVYMEMPGANAAAMPAPAAGPAAPMAVPAAPAAPSGVIAPGDDSSRASSAALDAMDVAAAQLQPGTIRSSLQGMSALGRGDVKGAFNAALDLVPGGSVARDGIAITMKLLHLG
jgi:hypothetical protein